jgi:glycogen debranching enzyme
MKPRARLENSLILFLLLCIALVSFGVPRSIAQSSRPSLQLSRVVRPWEFVSSTGTKAAIFGNEAGHFEAWVYPLKILSDFHLAFHFGPGVTPADAFIRTVTVRPESTTLVFASDTFQVRETIFVPVFEQGSVVILEVDTAEPLEIEAIFQRDLQLEWPAGLGGSYINWDSSLGAFEISEDRDKFAGLVGSPGGVFASQDYASNYANSPTSSFLLGSTKKGHDTKAIILAGSVNGLAPAIETYKRLASSYPTLLKQSEEYYQKFLERTVELDLPDAKLQEAYDWSRISMIQGLVENPYLGKGLVAGYRTSGDSHRPGFAWFFGRDSLWTTLALSSMGDFETARTALAFLGTYQRADGKIPHEVPQSATLCSWFTDYTYAYASADATPLYLIAMNDYVSRSGDSTFARENWDHISRAYKFLESTNDAQGLASNYQVGHGWIEGGPLLPVKCELYQASLGIEGVRAFASLSKQLGEKDELVESDASIQKQKRLLNDLFWSSDRNAFAYALDKAGKRLDTPSVLSAVPMWFSLLDETKAEANIDILADSDQQTDWGMRILSSNDPRYNPSGYHYGSVWPLFTGWASVGEYRYHRALTAYANLWANALLALDGSPGHATEALSGQFYEPLSYSSPHQIWSSAMLVSPLLRGLLGIDVAAASHQVTFSPHVPIDWDSFHIRNLQVGSTALELQFTQSAGKISLEVHRSGTGECTLDFLPGMSLRAKISEVKVDGKDSQFSIKENEEDAHLVLHLEIKKPVTTVSIRLRDDFQVSVTPMTPSLGGTSEGIRFVRESWNAGRDAYSLEVAGIPGREYVLPVSDPRNLVSVDGAKLESGTQTKPFIKVKIPTSPETSYVHAKITFHFARIAQ